LRVAERVAGTITVCHMVVVGRGGKKTRVKCKSVL